MLVAPRERAIDRENAVSDRAEDRETIRAADRVELKADCARCFGLCCVAPAFSASADFAIDKPAGHACPNLQLDFSCGIHSRLREHGFPGCTVYDCFGAGQQVAQVTFGGQDWRRAPDTAQSMFDAFAIMRQLHELLWYLTEALTLHPGRQLHEALTLCLAETERLTHGSADALRELDLAAQRENVNALLRRASELVRSPVRHHREDLRGADLLGASLRGADLRGANLRGSRLIAADLRGADLRLADLTGADMRDADIRGADLSDACFVTRPQMNAARGDAETRLPASHARPAHWSRSDTTAAAGTQ